MPFPPASEHLAQAQIQDASKPIPGAPLTQSRETGEVTPSYDFNKGPVTKQDTPEAKPWAHFVAGGYCILENTQDELCPGFDADCG